MPVIYRASFGYLLRHPWQLTLALLGICVGVAVMVAVDLANESSRRAFLLSMDAVNGEATHQVVAGPSGVDETIYTQLRVTHGIRPIAPVIAGNVRLAGTTVQVLGVDLFAEREFRAYSLAGATERSVVGGRQDGTATDLIARVMTEPGAFLASAGTAAQLGLVRDREVPVTANGRTHPAVLVGTFGGAAAERLDALVVTDIASAQRWLGMAGRLSRIDVKIGPGDDTLARRIRTALPDDLQLLTAAGRTQTTLEMSNAFMTNLTAMSLLALLVGIFLIYNSVAFAVLQRRGLIGVLRALGLTRREVFGLILAEAAVLGIIGALGGLALGIFLGEQLLFLVARSISDHFFVVSVTGVSVPPASIAKGLIAGLGATIGAAAIPAAEAAGVAPRLAMTRSAVEQRAGRAAPRLAWIGLLTIASAAALVAFSGTSLVAGLTALFLLILGIALTVPVAARYLARAAAGLVAKPAGMVGRLAMSGVAESLSRTGVAIVALAVAVSATVGVTVMVESFRDSVGTWLSNTLQSDIYVGVPRGVLDSELIDDLVAVPGIAEYSTSRRTWLETGTERVRLVALDMAPGSYQGTVLRDAEPEDVWPAFDGGGAVLVSDAYAYRRGVATGDTIILKTRGGDRAFLVAAVYQSYDSNDGAILMSRRTYDIFYDDPAINSLGLYLEEGVDPDSVMDALEQVSAGRQDIVTTSNARIRELSLQIFDRTFVITDVLYWLAVGVAIIGILGAMLALQLEQARELAVLRALGMTEGQLAGLVVTQTGFIGLLAGLAAIPMGLVMAVLLIEVINRRAFGWQMDTIVNPAVLATALALAVGAALVAGLYPAWRAAKAVPALAMREE